VAIREHLQEMDFDEDVIDCILLYYNDRELKDENFEHLNDEELEKLGEDAILACPTKFFTVYHLAIAVAVSLILLILLFLFCCYEKGDNEEANVHQFDEEDRMNDFRL
jgi:ferredoxin